MSSFAKWMRAWSQPATSARSELDQRRLRLALAVLVIALFVVVLRDIRDLRTPTPVNVEPVASVENTPPATASDVQNEAQTEAPPTPAQAAPTRSRPSKQKHERVKRPVVDASQLLSGNDTPAGTAIVATDRAVLPPMQVEVVAGNQHRPLATRNPSVKVDMQPDDSTDASQTSNPSSNAPPTTSAQVSVSPDVAAHVAHSVAPNYPLLAKQMKVQGAVVLQALIDRGGKIQNLRVLSGPTILAAAAQEAVKQWRFKPYYQDGQPVETEARVSVNFTISTF
jgi:TonB family protein